MIKEIPRIGAPANKDMYSFADKEIYKETQARAKKKFGEDSLAYKTIMNGINTKGGTGSQFFFNTEMNLYLPKEQRVISLEDIEKIYSFSDADRLFDSSIYMDIPEIILRSESFSYYRNKVILENLVSQVKRDGFEFSAFNPLRISGLELKKDDRPENKYGLLLTIGQDTKIDYDERFAYGNKLIKLGKQTKELFQKDNGLSTLCLATNNLSCSIMCSNDGCLDGSMSDGPVVLKGTEVVA